MMGNLRVVEMRECPACRSMKVDVKGSLDVTQRHYGHGLTTFEYSDDFEPMVIHCRDCGREGRLL